MSSCPKEFQGRIDNKVNWRDIVAWIGDLPPMPKVAAKAISLIEKQETTAKELQDLLNNDPALAAKILKIANSAMFSRQREINTIQQAVMIIGFKALKGIIMAASLRQLNKRFTKIDRLVWENSMGTAMASLSIAKALKKHYAEEIFLLGLLHNLGQVAMLVNETTRNKYNLVLKLIEEEECTYVEAEHKVYGFSNPLIGALLAKKWNFPADTCQIILHHQDQLPQDAPSSPLEEMVAIVKAGEALCHLTGIGSPSGYPSRYETLKDCLVYCGAAEDNTDELIEMLTNNTQELFEQEGSLYT
ncbi:MAG: HDOD domain-containing protein [Candidatus Dadabacteria bacterium]|nr:MAG: HDOD domain-containing protein [Candidatus Dadabacteria bacterium]